MTLSRWIVALAVSLLWALPAVAGDEPVLVPEPSAAALAYYKSGNWLWAAGQAASVLIPLGLIASGFSTRLARFCERRAGRWILAVVAFAAIYTIIDAVLTLPLSFYSSYVRAHAYGLSRQTPGRWFEVWWKGLGVSLVLSILCAAGVFSLLRWSPRRWWLWCGLAALPLLLFMAVIQPVVLDPLFNRYEPLRDQALEARIRQVAEQAGIGDSRIQQVDKSRDTRAVNAFVNGWMGTRQIVLWDTLIERLEEDEVVAIVGHEIGHYRLDHVFRGIVVAALLMLAGLYGLQRTGQVVVRRLGSRLGIERLSDVAALPLLVGLGNLIMLVLLPIGYAHSRYMEREADRFGLELTRLNRPAATSFVKLQEANLSNPRPGWLYTTWRATHPSLAERVEFCNQYQPWQEGGVLVYADLLISGKAGMTRYAGSVPAGLGSVVEEAEGHAGAAPGTLDGLLPAQ